MMANTSVTHEEVLLQKNLTLDSASGRVEMKSKVTTTPAVVSGEGEPQSTSPLEPEEDETRPFELVLLDDTVKPCRSADPFERNPKHTSALAFAFDYRIAEELRFTELIQKSETGRLRAWHRALWSSSSTSRTMASKVATPDAKWVEDLIMGAEVAVRVHCDLAVRMPIDGQTTEFSLARADTYMQWITGSVGQIQNVHDTNQKFREIHVSKDIVPLADCSIVEQHTCSIVRAFTTRLDCDIVCYTPDGNNAWVSTVVDVLTSAVFAHRLRVAEEGPAGDKEWWCLIKIDEEYLPRALEALETSGIFAYAKNECTVGFVPAFVPLGTRGGSQAFGVAASAYEADTSPPGHVTAFVTIGEEDAARLDYESVRRLLTNQHALYGVTAQLRYKEGLTVEKARIVSFCPDTELLLVRPSWGGFAKVPLSRFVGGMNIYPTRFEVTLPTAVEHIQSKFQQCKVCFDFKPRASYPEFCFTQFFVTGDRFLKNHPRHPLEVCGGCLKSHCEIALSSGQLFVPCPAETCGRNLQTMELQPHVKKRTYETLLAGLRDVETAGSRAFTSATEIAGLTLKKCPKCAAAIEKDGGCSTMRCFRCGSLFTGLVGTWESLTTVVQGTTSSSA